MYVIYSGDDEIIICTEEDEHEAIEEYFQSQQCRDIEVYDRRVQESPPCITSEVKQQW